MDSKVNVAYTKEYRDHLANIDRYLFRADCFSGEEIKHLDDLTIITRHYQCDDHPGYPFNLSGFDNEVILNGSPFYRYRSYDESGFHWPVAHASGGRYLVFTQGLYGYSVLDLSTGQDYRYYPKGSFPTGESFIWCNLHYNPANSMAAVDGCYWACPSSILLVDLAEPMREAIFIDVNDYYREEYDDLQFLNWNGVDLEVNASPGRDGKHIIIPELEYRRWMKQEAGGLSI